MTLQWTQGTTSLTAINDNGPLIGVKAVNTWTFFWWIQIHFYTFNLSFPPSRKRKVESSNAMLRAYDYSYL